MGGFSTIEVRTRGSQDILDITSAVRDVVRGSGVRDGLCVVFALHTTGSFLPSHDSGIYHQ